MEIKIPNNKHKKKYYVENRTLYRKEDENTSTQICTTNSSKTGNILEAIGTELQEQHEKGVKRNNFLCKRAVQMLDRLYCIIVEDSKVYNEDDGLYIVDIDRVITEIERIKREMRSNEQVL